MPRANNADQYRFRLLCKQCNSYLFTTITQVPCPGMMFNLIVLACMKCDVIESSVEQTFGHKEHA